MAKLADKVNILQKKNERLSRGWDLLAAIWWWGRQQEHTLYGEILPFLHILDKYKLFFHMM